MKTSSFTTFVLIAQIIRLSAYDPNNPTPAVTNGPKAPPGSVPVARVDGVSLDHRRLTALLKYFPSHVPVDLELKNPNKDLNPLVIELPKGTAAFRISSGFPLNTVSFQKFNEEFLLLEGNNEPSEGVTEFDDGPRASIPLTRVPSAGKDPKSDQKDTHTKDFSGYTPVTITTDQPKCACNETSCSKTGTTPTTEDPASSLSPIGLTSSFPLGLKCCTSGQVPGTAVWAPTDLSESTSGSSWNSLSGHLVALPNAEMLGSGLDRVASGDIEQWRTEASLVEFKSEVGKLTITTYLDPPLDPVATGLYDPTGLFELARTVIQAGENPGELLYLSYFEEVEVQRFLINATTVPNSPINGQATTIVTRNDLKTGLVTETKTITTWATGEMVVTVSKYDNNLSNLSQKTRETHALRKGWYRLVERIDAFGSPIAQTTTYDRFDSAGHALRIRHGDGSWTLRLKEHSDLPNAYDIKVHPFLDSVVPQATLANLSTVNLDAHLVSYREGDTLYTRAAGEITGKVKREIYLAGDRETVSESITTHRDATTTLLQERDYHTFAEPRKRLRGKPIRTQSPEGNITHFDYEFGSWNTQTESWTANPNGEDLRTRITAGHDSPASLVNRGRRTVFYENLHGQELFRQEQINLGGGQFSTYSSTTTVINGPQAPYGHLIETKVKDGRVINERIENSSFSTTTYDQTGRRSITVKDAAGRTVSREQFFDHLPGRTSEKTSYSYVGLTTTTTRTAGINVTTSSRTVDLLDRPVETVAVTGKITTYEYPDPQTTRTLFLGTVTSESVRHLDGSAKQQSRLDPFDGNDLKVVSTRTQAVLPGGEIETTLSHFGQADTTQVVDWTGRTLRTTSPSGTGTGFVTTTYQYTASGQLERVSSDADNVPDRLTFYHELGHVVKSGHDTNGDGQLILGQDRMTETDTLFVDDNGVWWSETTTTSQSSPTAPPLSQVSRSRLSFSDPALLSETHATGPHGGTTVSLTTIDLEQDGTPRSTVTTTVNRPGTNLDAVTVSVDGYPVSATSHLSSVAETWTYVEPATGGFLTIHANRLGGVTTTTQNRLGQTIEVKNPVNQRMLYRYETDHTKAAIGQLVATTNGENETTTYEYDLLGRKTFEGGASYPVAYEYDVASRMTFLITYRDEDGVGTYTSWLYHPHSGLLLNKRYDATGTNQGPSYDYDDAGRLSKLTRARNIPGTNTPVEVEYEYTPAGDLLNILYNDTTPDVTYSNHDLFGRPRSVAQTGYGTVTYTYDDLTGQLAREDYDSGHTLLPGLSLVSGFGRYPTSGTFLKRTRHTISMNQQSLFDDNTYYNLQGQPYFQFRAIPQGSSTNYHSHGVNEFVEGTNLARSVQIYDWSSSGSFTTHNNVDSSYRLNSKRTVSGLTGGTLTSVGYAFDHAGRRTHATREDATTWRYDYNERGEVRNAAKLLPDQAALAGQQFTYLYDDIGNRTSARYGGGTGTNAGADREISYTANALNQYTAISHPQTADVLGLSDPANGPVSVTGELAPPDQQGPRFRAEVEADLPDGEWVEIEVGDASNPPVSQGSRWIPAASTSPAHDADGNLLNDGRWIYSWDAENRLTRMVPTPEALAGGHPHHILEFAYDHQSRRIRKRILDGTNGNASLGDRRFLYDGWNLIAEFEAGPQNSLDPMAYHAWSNDLSSTPQGAGGVGGLYASHVRLPGDGPWETFYPSYDGNGNIIAWIDDQAQVVQRLDYDAFGNQLIQQGSLPGNLELNFGFSTKYQDQETGLLYYGYRYYDPVTGRWPSRDPVAEGGGANLYGFVGNSGVNAIDLFGLKKEFVPKLQDPNIGHDNTWSQYFKFAEDWYDWWTFGQIWEWGKTKPWYNINISDAGGTLTSGVQYHIWKVVINRGVFFDSWRRQWDRHEDAIESGKLSFEVKCKCVVKNGQEVGEISVSPEKDQVSKEVGGKFGETLSAGVGFKVSSIDGDTAKIDLSAAAASGWSIDWKTEVNYSFKAGKGGVEVGGGGSSESSGSSNLGAKINRGPTTRTWKCVEKK